MRYYIKIYDVFYTRFNTKICEVVSSEPLNVLRNISEILEVRCISKTFKLLTMYLIMISRWIIYFLFSTLLALTICNLHYKDMCKFTIIKPRFHIRETSHNI